MKLQVGGDTLLSHVRRMDLAAPAHQALYLSVTKRQGSGQIVAGIRQPRKCWVELVTTSTRLSPSECCDGSVSTEDAQNGRTVLSVTIVSWYRF